MVTALVLLGAAAAALVGLRRPLVAHLLRTALRDRGVDVTSLAVADVGFGRLHLRDLSFADGAVTADEVVADYALASLRAGQVEAVTIAGATVRLAQLPAGASADVEGPAVRALRLLSSLGRVTLRDVRVVADTRYGEVITRLDGTLVAAGAGATAEVSYAVTGSPLHATGSVSGSVQSDGRGSLTIAVEDATVRQPGLEIEDLHGRAEVGFIGARVDRAHVELNVRQVQASDPVRGFATARARLDFASGRLEAVAELGAEDIHVHAEASLREEGAGTVLRVRTQAFAEASAFARTAALPQPAAGQATLTLEASARLAPLAQLAQLDLDALVVAALRRFEVEASLDLFELSYPGRVASLSGSLPLRAAVTPDDIYLWLADDARFVAADIDPGWLRGLGAGEVASAVPAHLELRLPAATSAPVVAWPCPAGGWQVGWSANAHVAGRRPRLALDLAATGALELDAEGSVARFTAGEVRLDGRGLTLAGTELDEVRVAGRLSGAGDQLRADVDLSGSAPASQAAGLAARAITFRAPIRLVRTGDRLDVALRAPATVRVEQLELADGTHLTAPATAELATVALARTCTPTGRCSLRHHGSAALPRVALAAAAAEPEPTTLELFGLAIDWRGTLGGEIYAAVAAERGRVDAFAESVAASQLTARLEVSAAGGPVTIEYAIASLRELGDAPLLAPLERVRGRLHGAGGDASLELDGTFHVGGHGPFPTRGHFDPATRSGELRIESGALELRPGLLAPVDLFPDLGYLRDVSGRVEATIRLVRAGGVLSSELHARFEEIAARIDDDRVEGLKTEVYLDSLFPLHGPAGQILRIRRISGTGDVGLDDAVGRYAVVPGPPPEMVFESFTARVAGGEMSTDDLVLSSDDLAQRRLVLNLTEIDLSEVFRQTGIDGLSGTGRVTGRLPVLVTGEDLAISDGHLEATGPGILEYDSATARAALGGHGEYVDLLVAALRRFHYQRLAISLDTTSESHVQLRLELDGSNPDVLDGYPFRINITIGGDISNLLDALRRGYLLRDELIRKSTGR